jgi:hypothetical protein
MCSLRIPHGQPKGSASTRRLTAGRAPTIRPQRMAPGGRRSPAPTYVITVRRATDTHVIKEPPVPRRLFIFQVRNPNSKTQGEPPRCGGCRPLSGSEDRSGHRLGAVPAETNPPRERRPGHAYQASGTRAIGGHSLPVLSVSCRPHTRASTNPAMTEPVRSSGCTRTCHHGAEHRDRSGRAGSSEESVQERPKSRAGDGPSAERATRRGIDLAALESRLGPVFVRR